MKNLFLTILFVSFIVGCNKSDDNREYTIINGIYEGHFSYQGTNYWYKIGLDQNSYDEWFSGGVFLQKSLWCYTVGTYTINNDQLIFELDSFQRNPDPSTFVCNPDWLMPGEYTIDYLDNDSIVFKKGEGDSSISYHLKREDDN